MPISNKKQFNKTFTTSDPKLIHKTAFMKVPNTVLLRAACAET